MAYRIACFGLALGALSACTITIQTAPQPANGYYVAAPVAAAPVAAAPAPAPVYEQPAQRPVRVVAAPVATVVPAPSTGHTATAAPAPTTSAVRPPTLLRPPTAGQAHAVGTAPAVTPPAATASPPQTSGPLSPPVRRPTGDQKAETRDKTDDSQVK